MQYLFQARSKPLWQQTCPSFHLSKKDQNDDKSEELTVKNEYSPGKIDIFTTTQENLSETKTYVQYI